MILVTGGTGLLGTHLIYSLIEKGEKVRAIRRKSSKIDRVLKIFKYYTDNAEKMFAEIEWVEADILDYDSVYKSMENIDVVYHSAAMISFNPAMKNKMVKNNTQGTANVVNASIENKIKKLCHVSSIAALGFEIDGKHISEETKRNPSKEYSGYAISKFESELEVWRGINEGLNAVIINPSIIIGPGDWKNSSASLIYTVWKGIKYYTNGINGFVDVKDVVSIMIKLTNSNISNERYIVSSENRSFKTVFEKIADELGKKRASKKASPLMLSLLWRLNLIAKKIFGVKLLITKENAKSAFEKSFYKNNKVVDKLDYKFLTVDESIKQTCKFFINDMKV